MPRVNIENFQWWLSLVNPSNLKDNQFEVLMNMFYNSDKRLQSRYWVKTFWNAIDNKPITSYFFFQRDDTWLRTALCTSGTNMYKYDETTWDWNSIKSGLTEFEADWTTRTRWSFAVYKNVVYMCNGVDCYASYDWTTYTELWVSSVWTATFDGTTNIVTVTGHWLAENASIKFTTTGTLPTGITSGQYYYMKYIDANTFYLSLTPSGTTLDFTWNWTATTTMFKTVQPRIRYIRYMWDRVLWAWDDFTPSSLYYTASLPTNANTLLTNILVVWWDELWRINGLLDVGSVILAFKNKKIYSISVSANTSTPIDSQNWWFCDRAIKNVENWIVYFNDNWIDSLKQRSWVSWSEWLQSKWLSDDLSSLVWQITPYSYNYWCGWYNSNIANYYYSFDTESDRTPDTTLVRSSLTGGWSQYNYPAMYDYGFYIDSDWLYHYLIASANGWQMYEIETGFTDNGLWIDTELLTKRWDFGDSTIWKIYDTIDIVGLKNEWSEIIVELLVDWEVVSSSTIDDTFINLNSVTRTIWSYPIWVYTIGWWSGTWEDIDLYDYKIRIPAFNGGSNIQIRMYSSDNPNVWTLDKIMINYQQETLDLFPTNNIS